MTRHQSFDPPASSHAVVIGAGLGGLAAAMRLGARGWRVTVLDRLDIPGGRATSITSHGHRFDLGPTIVTAPEVFRKLFADCGRDFDSAVTLRALDPFYTIRWPDGSHLDARAKDADMEAEIARLSPGDVDGWRKFLDDAERRYVVGYEGMLTKPMHKLWETLRVLPEFAMLRADRSILGLARKRVKDERLRMALSFHPLFIGGDPSRVTSMYALVSHLEKTQGVHYAMGGVGAMAQAMADVVTQQGGTLRLGTQVDCVSQDETGRVNGVVLSGGETVAADIVVSNADAGHTYSHLMRKQRRKRWTQAKLNRTRWSMGLFVWYFGTKGTRGMWPDLGHHTIQSGPRYEGLLRDIFRRGHLAEDMSLYIHRPSLTDPTVAPRGDDTFYALSPVPHLGHRSPINWAQEAERYRQKVQDQLERTVMPGLGQHISASMCLTPEDFRDRYLSLHGAGFSVEPRILQSAWFRPHNVSEEVPGLFLVGAGTHPGAGLPGVVASAEVLEQVVPPVGARTPDSVAITTGSPAQAAE
ncbi:phytoene desaturase (neurosporene-forming) [Jannaschia pagri]|uniref:Phytoene dehydrogenase n=1 Tax=Jannaschia pagri TaxID=2829797 RepID=A0ABQ4NLA0_9RHOB|nr:MULTISPECIES: phytoene desaturase [unclassified Jannaschia]GIT91364.1 phytoene desaturase (neurosporene-forming) [Jannaschia sp. AI_61]GIT95198.1 phytoene desaturase (neurosporene-forming) [Jannaschia sp. AI_62]